MNHYHYFLISPVRRIDDWTRRKIEAWVNGIESRGLSVYWPLRDTVQDDDTGGLRICRDTLRAIKASDTVAIWWDESSEGRLFDFGMAFALKKPIVVVNEQRPIPVGRKSYRNVLLQLDGRRTDRYEEPAPVEEHPTTKIPKGCVTIGNRSTGECYGYISEQGA